MAKSGPKDTDDLLAMIRALGYRVDLRPGHTRILRPNGTFLMTLPLTPSSSRSVMNSWRRFLRAKEKSPRATARGDGQTPR